MTEPFTEVTEGKIRIAHKAGYEAAKAKYAQDLARLSERVDKLLVCINMAKTYLKADRVKDAYGVLEGGKE